MKRSALAAVAACCLKLATPTFAAAPPADDPPPDIKTAAASPAAQCLADIRGFDNRMEADGYWLGGSGYGYGYPMGGVGYGYGDQSLPGGGASAADFRNARPGYEVRVLLAAAIILAEDGKQRACESVLATMRQSYAAYLAGVHEQGLRIADAPAWQQQQITTARPVNDDSTALRADQLIGTDVRTPRNVPLGSIHDLVLSPKTGKIAYLVVARGGLFGFDQAYIPVPWEDFKVTQNANLLVLDVTLASMKTAPEVKRDWYAKPGLFAQQSQTIDGYWHAHLQLKTAE
jgi:sporulation protein YlmC with PRC-barrel domain